MVASSAFDCRAQTAFASRAHVGGTHAKVGLVRRLHRLQLLRQVRLLQGAVGCALQALVARVHLLLRQPLQRFVHILRSTAEVACDVTRSAAQRGACKPVSLRAGPAHSRHLVQEWIVQVLIPQPMPPQVLSYGGLVSLGHPCNDRVKHLYQGAACHCAGAAAVVVCVSPVASIRSGVCRHWSSLLW